ncbi:MAG: hypothetical protein Fur0032_04650 [Terrimicrobiaceae bacterium]
MLHRIFLTISPLVCLCLLAGCGKKPTVAEAPAADSQAIEPAASPQASLPQPSVSIRKLYIAESFQTESTEGIHDFPRGGEVELIAIIDDDYLVQRNGVSVRISRTFFSETPVSPEAAETSVPTASTLTQETAEIIPADAPDDVRPEPVSQSVAAPQGSEEEAALVAEEPPPPLSAEDRRIEELTESIRELNDRIRSVRQTLATSQSEPEPAEVRRLQKKRDELSEELTGLVKP